MKRCASTALRGREVIGIYWSEEQARTSLEETLVLLGREVVLCEPQWREHQHTICDLTVMDHSSFDKFRDACGHSGGQQAVMVEVDAGVERPTEGALPVVRVEGRRLREHSLGEPAQQRAGAGDP